MTTKIQEKYLYYTPRDGKKPRWEIEHAVKRKIVDQEGGTFEVLQNQLDEAAKIIALLIAKLVEDNPNNLDWALREILDGRFEKAESSDD